MKLLMLFTIIAKLFRKLFATKVSDIDENEIKLIEEQLLIEEAKYEELYTKIEELGEMFKADKARYNELHYEGATESNDSEYLELSNGSKSIIDEMNEYNFKIKAVQRSISELEKELEIEIKLLRIHWSVVKQVRNQRNLLALKLAAYQKKLWKQKHKKKLLNLLNMNLVISTKNLVVLKGFQITRIH